MVSVGSGGAQGNDRSGAPAISGNGRYVAFCSNATNFSDTSHGLDVFVYDRKTSETKLLSSSEVKPGPDRPAMSSDGRFVAFAQEGGDNAAQRLTLLERGVPELLPAEAVGESSFTAKWKPVEEAAGYRIDVSPDSNFTSFVTGYQDKAVSGASITVNGLDTGTTYYYRVRAVMDGDKVSSSSAFKDATTVSPEVGGDDAAKTNDSNGRQAKPNGHSVKAGHASAGCGSGATVNGKKYDTVFSDTVTAGWLGVIFSFKNFSVPEPGQGRLVITKTAPDKKYRAGFLFVNGQLIPIHQFLRSSETVFTTEITLKSKNWYWLMVNAQRGAGLSIEFQAESPEPVEPPTASLSIEPSVITLGGSATLTWSVGGADSISIDNSVGSVADTGSKEVYPAATTTYTMTAENAAGATTATASITVRPDVEPQPEGSFGAMYEDLIPLDTTLKSYDDKRFSLVTGKVTDVAGAPLAGVKVSIHDHAEFGSVRTDANGAYTLPLEGGGAVTVAFEKQGYINSHRKVVAPWNDTVVVPQLALVVMDDKATLVTFGCNETTQSVHQSTVIDDGHGVRSATVVFPAGVKAYETDANGVVIRELEQGEVSVTDFPTPESMPAELPPTSAFTWCGDFRIAGADRVSFNKPVVVFVDNFLGFDVGTAVPVGYYDTAKAAWIAEQNGRVVELLDTDADGVADAYDADGDKLSDGAVEGLDDTTTYKLGSTYWRVELEHFTSVDCNWPYGPPDDAKAPTVDDTPRTEPSPNDDDKTQTGCFVSNRERSYNADFSIVGTGLFINYSSQNTQGYKQIFTVHVSGDSLPASLKSIIVKILIGGRILETEITPELHKAVVIAWDGLDHLGRQSMATAAEVFIGYVYDVVYYANTNDLARAFAKLGDRATPVRARDVCIIWSRQVVKLVATYSSPHSGMPEGWSMSNHHRTSPASRNIVYKGDGSVYEQVADLFEVYAELGNIKPQSIVAAPDGSTFFSGRDGSRPMI